MNNQKHLRVDMTLQNISPSPAQTRPCLIYTGPFMGFKSRCFLRCVVFTLTNVGIATHPNSLLYRLTLLDIVTAHTVLPGRDDTALLLEAAMRSQGWMGGRMEEKQRALDEQLKRKGRQKSVHENISKVLGLQNQWWDSCEEDEGFSSDDPDGEDDQLDEELYVSHISSEIPVAVPYLVMETLKLDFTSMLAWSP
ncbi:uncharacterized protein EDB93DRAFT_1308711 [Suillus bovinus]|uniref:uncharacterized protein n=1 Tax=Suillus bovinus TaxID=48563 RepID=UPI001B85BAE0|nr:uncharacterized protein EDB93DRAFT_1308711 [Suillus bovinus]KAG2133199.1 hypothetical protein EDB93DRAFT_1308711 [Suillus bovinus]